MVQSASGTNRDKQGKSFVESPARGPNYSAQEVFVSNKNSDPIPVDPTTRGVSKSEYNEVSAVALQTLVVLSKTIIAGSGIDITSAECSGDNRSIFSVEINGSIKNKKRIYYTKYNTNFNFHELELLEGDKIEIKVENKTNQPGDFNCTLNYNEFAI